MSDDPKGAAPFGPNVWLIDEMFREFKEHPESVSHSWREFFSDYRPAAGRMAPPLPPADLAPAGCQTGCPGDILVARSSLPVGVPLLVTLKRCSPRTLLRP